VTLPEDPPVVARTWNRWFDSGPEAQTYVQLTGQTLHQQTGRV